MGSERRTLSECQPCLGHSSPSTLVRATRTHLQGFEAVLASNNQDPQPFLPPPFLDHLLVSSGSQAPEMTPGSNIRRAGLRGARGPCSTSGHLGGSGCTRLSQPHHSPHQPTGQTDLSDVSSSELLIPDSSVPVTVVSLDRRIGPLLREPRLSGLLHGK